ncbi:hypothetical protein ASG99_12410 [Bacillus sp. Soil768D1]|nr:hypothetical protein ASG99_12410 [Bacillus sp. Soil768D1]
MGSELQQFGNRVWPRVLRHKIDEQIYDKLTDYNINIDSNAVIYKTYNKLLKHLKSLSFEDEFEVTVHDLHYDWRKSNLLHTKKLAGLIKEIKVDEVIIVAHSMGGIIARLFLNEYGNSEDGLKIKKLITLGTPWKGSPYAYKALNFGINVISDRVPVVINKEISKRIAPSFISLYQLLPNKYYNMEYVINENVTFLEKDGKHIFDFGIVEQEHYKTKLEENGRLPLYRRKIIRIYNNM